MFRQVGWIWVLFFFYVFKDFDSVSIHKHGKKKLANDQHYIASSVSGQDESNSCAVIGYTSRQDGAILSAWDYLPCPTTKTFPTTT